MKNVVAALPISPVVDRTRGVNVECSEYMPTDSSRHDMPKHTGSPLLPNPSVMPHLRPRRGRWGHPEVNVGFRFPESLFRMLVSRS